MEKIRIQFDVSPEVKANLGELKKRIGAASEAEVFRKALACFDMVTEHEQSGGQMILKNKDGSSERIRLL